MRLLRTGKTYEKAAPEGEDLRRIVPSLGVKLPQDDELGPHRLIGDIEKGLVRHQLPASVLSSGPAGEGRSSPIIHVRFLDRDQVAVGEVEELRLMMLPVGSRRAHRPIFVDPLLVGRRGPRRPNRPVSAITSRNRSGAEPLQPTLSSSR
jgi:hypothetical protein